MIQKTKIGLSESELQLVCDKEWILTKQVIIEKVYRLFGALAPDMQQLINEKKKLLPAEAGINSPKISRGENYKGLPYVMLDYPRHFTKDDTLAIRTFFWWGNFFSINLQLAGPCLQKAIPALKQNFETLQADSYWISVHSNPWEHYFEENNYRQLKSYTKVEFAGILHRESFIKIATRIPLHQWDAAPEFLLHHFSKLARLLQINFQADERDPSPGIPTIGFDL